MKITIDGEVMIPSDSAPSKQIEWANKVLGIAAQQYCCESLGRISGIHPIKIHYFQHLKRDLMLSELRKIANCLDINLKVSNDRKSNA